MLLSFMFLCFGIGGVQLFSASGQLHSRCVGADVSVEPCALAGAAQSAIVSGMGRPRVSGRSHVAPTARPEVRAKTT